MITTISKKRKCKICGEELVSFTSHIVKDHNISIQEYFSKYYDIPINSDYDILDSDLFKIVDEMREENVTDCIEHFKKILAEVDNNVARLQFRFTNSAYEIYHYLKIPLQKSPKRRNKKELLAMNESLAQDHRHHDNRTAQCNICHQNVRYGYMLWHAKTVHNIDKRDYLIRYHNVPSDANFDLISYGLVKDMENELSKYHGKFDNYHDCYQYIYNKFKNNITMIESFDYDINKVCQSLHIDKNSKTGLAQVNQKKSYTTPRLCRTGFRDDLGFMVRSSWEANVARILKKEHISFFYEKEKFNLIMPDGTETYYTPDFYLDDNVLLEVKGHWRKGNRAKIAAFKEQYPQYLLCIIDKYIYAQLQQQYSSAIKNWE